MRRFSLCLRCTCAISACIASMLIPIAAWAGLVLTIDTPKLDYLLDECIYITVTMKNTGSQSAEVVNLLTPDMGIVSFEITPPGDGSRLYNSCGKATLDISSIAKSVVRLAPGDKYSASVDLSHEPGDKNPRRLTPLLSRSGQYLIRATYATHKDWGVDPLIIGSNELRIVVSEPQGADRATYDLLHCSPSSKVYGPWSLAGQQTTCFTELLTRFPQSRYAVYARFYLACWYNLVSGEVYERGTPEMREASKAAAVLFSSVAKATGETPLGVLGMMCAGRNYAKAGDLDLGRSLLEKAFCSPVATDEDRIQALSWLHLLESGYWQTGHSVNADTRQSLSLRRFAKALGFSVDWDPATKEATVSGYRFRSTFRPQVGTMSIDGANWSKVAASLVDAQICVSPSVVATLMVERWGEGVANTLSSLLAKAPETRKD